MIATVDIQHPEVKNYNQQELEKLIVEVVYSYFDNKYNENDDDGIDGKLYPIDYDELPDNVKKRIDELDKMTEEERREKFFSI